MRGKEGGGRREGRRVVGRREGRRRVEGGRGKEGGREERGKKEGGREERGKKEGGREETGKKEGGREGKYAKVTCKLVSAMSCTHVHVYITCLLIHEAYTLSDPTVISLTVVSTHYRSIYNVAVLNQYIPAAGVR